MDKVNILISGSGSLYGVAVIQFLLKSDLDLKIVACDINSRTLGLYLAHRGYIVPPVYKKALFFERIIDIITKEDISAIFVTSSRELNFFSAYKAVIEAKTGTKVFTNPPNVLKICNDKWNTVEFLKKHNFHYPFTLRYPEDKDQIDIFIKKVRFPVVVKPRKGAGSKDIYIANNFRKLKTFLEGKSNFVIQQYLPDEQGEFTTGICVGAGGKVLSGITLKRYLFDGMTMVADSEKFDKITDYCRQVARVLKPYGPCNFQLRLLDEEPYIFEINPRFSSSTGMRSLLGVNEAEILIRAEILGETITKPQIKECSVIRQFTDYLVPTEKIILLEKNKLCIN